MRWLTNARTNDVNSYICELTCGHEGKRQLITGMPKESAARSMNELVDMGMFGIYEVSPCACAFCTEQRRRKGQELTPAMMDEFGAELLQIDDVETTAWE